MTSSTTPKIATDDDRSIGSRIALLRAARGMSQTALGQVLGVSFQQVQKYEKGRNRVGAGRLQTIAEHLGVPISTFFEDRTEKSVGTESISNFLQDPEILDLVRTFVAISDKTVRRSVLSIVKAAATLENGAVAAQPTDVVPKGTTPTH